MPIARSKFAGKYVEELGGTGKFEYKGILIWHVELVNIFDSEIGEGTKIASFVEIGGSKIGSFCKIECGAFIPHGSVIEDRVFIGPNVSLTNDRYPNLLVDEWKVEPVTVKYGARIGSHSVVVSGVTIGENALIGSGSVVTDDIPARATAYGNPARIKGYDRVRDKVEKLLDKHKALAGSEFATELRKIFDQV